MTRNNGALGHSCSRSTVQHSLTCRSPIRSATKWLSWWLTPAGDKGVQPCPKSLCLSATFHDPAATQMFYTNYQGLSAQPSLADELSKLISDPRTQNAIASITVRDGTTTVQLNAERHQCSTCKASFANKKSHDDHARLCRVLCAVHEQYVCGYSLKWDMLLTHAVNPGFSHTCCFYESCQSRYRIAKGWSNLDIIQHVIMDHTHLDKKEKEEMLMGTRRR